MFDINHDGKINFNELQQTMAKMGQPLTRKEALEMFKAMDENGDGVITFRGTTQNPSGLSNGCLLLFFFRIHGCLEPVLIRV